MMKSETVISIFIIVAILVVGIIMLSFMNDVFPEIAPTYDHTFAVGSAPYAYDTNEDSLTNIVVRQKLSDDAWETIDAANYTYVGNTVTVDAGALYV